jgi:hypothetical protein
MVTKYLGIAFGATLFVFIYFPLWTVYQVSGYLVEKIDSVMNEHTRRM